MKFPTLYKKTSTGAMQYWTISSEETNQGFTFGLGEIRTEYGQLNTDSPQITSEVIKEGKNIGKKNATTAIEQALAEAKARHEKQLKKGYVTSIEAAEKGETDSIIEGGIVPMLAHKFADHGHKIKFPAFAQAKLDGIRCIAILKDGKCTLWSRTRKQITSMTHIEKAIENAFKEDIILDGELFNKTSNLIPYQTFEVDGQIVYMDREDVPKLEGYSVCISKNGYPVVGIRREVKYIHRLVMGEPNSDVDHINRNKLDARKSNLRLTDMSGNIANTSKRKTNTSGYKGVTFFKRDNKWHAQITKDYEKFHIGYFDTAEEAARAYDEKAREVHGNFAVLNFPDTCSVEQIRNFEDIVSAVRSEKPTKQSLKVQYHVYDLPSNEPFSKRATKMRYIKSSWFPNQEVVKVETFQVEDEAQAMQYFDLCRSEGYEGAMLRNADGLYVNKRSYDLQKMKEFQDDEFEIVGIDEGRGKLVGHVGAFICKTKDGKEFLAKMSGDTEKLKDYFNNHKLWEGKLLTVKYQDLTGANSVPRFPVGISIRDYE